MKIWKVLLILIAMAAPTGAQASKARRSALGGGRSEPSDFAQGKTESADAGRFRLTLASEPAGLSVFNQKNSGSLYFLEQLSCPLLRWTQQKSVPWGGSCKIVKAQIECSVDPKLQFQNGQPVTAAHYLKSFQFFLNPQKPSPRADLLLPLKNAKEVLAGQKPATELGLKIETKN